MMDDTTFQKLQRDLEWFRHKRNEKFTAWIQAIQNASIVHLDPKEEWKEDDALIQVKRMSENHLQREIDVPPSEHEFDAILDVIKLPLPIPTEADQSASQLLFIRPDEYALFICTGKKNGAL